MHSKKKKEKGKKKTWSKSAKQLLNFMTCSKLAK